MTCSPDRTAPGGPPRPAARRRRLALAALATLAALAAAGVWYAVSRPAGLGPPETDLARADPAVARAVRDAQAAVRAAPRSAAAWGELGMILAAHGFRPQAHACFVRAEQLAPDETRWPYHQALWLSDSGDPAAALPKLERAVALCGDGPTAPELRLAELLLAQGRTDDAERHFRRVLAREPSDARAHLGLARMAWEGGDTLAARSHLAVSSRSRSAQKASHALLAEIERQGGNPRSAAEEMRLVSSLPDDWPWPDPFTEEVAKLQVGETAQYKRARAWVQRGRGDLAVPLLRDTVGNYPGADRDWVLLGRALLMQGDVPGAERALREAVRLAPASAEAQVYLGLALGAGGDQRAAAERFRRAAAESPGYTFAHFNLGRACAALGDRPGAIKAYRDALRCKPDYAEAHAGLGELLAQEGRYREAAEQLRAARDLRPDDPALSGRLEEVLKRAGAPSGP